MASLTPALLAAKKQAELNMAKYTDEFKEKLLKDEEQRQRDLGYTVVEPAGASPSPDLADLPALICGACSLIFSKGGRLWEAEHPSEVIGMCQCVPHDKPLPSQ